MRLRVRLPGRRALEASAEVYPGSRQPAPGERVARIKVGGLGEGLNRLAEVGFRAAGTIKLTLQESVVGLKTPTGGPLALRRRMLTRQELRPQRPRHRAGDLILQRKEIPVGAIVVLG